LLAQFIARRESNVFGGHVAFGLYCPPLLLWMYFSRVRFAHGRVTGKILLHMNRAKGSLIWLALRGHKGSKQGGMEQRLAPKKQWLQNKKSFFLV